MKVIGVDLDDVLAEFVPKLIVWHNRKFGTALKKKNIWSYNFWKVWDCSYVEALEKMYNFLASSEYREIRPVAGSQKGVDILRKDNELVVITSRPAPAQEIIDWLERYFSGRFSQVFHTNQYSRNLHQRKRKHEICKELDITTMIEDRLDYAVACAKNNIRLYLFDYPWNQADYLPDNITRVRSWSELVERINESRKQQIST